MALVLEELDGQFLDAAVGRERLDRHDIDDVPGGGLEGGGHPLDLGFLGRIEHLREVVDRLVGEHRELVARRALRVS